jgi:hypothetical protein
MPAVPSDAISVKFENLQELRTAIQTAQNNLMTNREDWMGYTTGTMSVGWADEAGMQNQLRNADFSKYGEENETFLANLMVAVQKAEDELRAAVQRSYSYMV